MMLDQLLTRISAAPDGSTPFVQTDKGLVFNGQLGRPIDYGHYFDDERGYRVFFGFRDSPAKNTWKPADLKRWAEGLAPVTDEDRALVDICLCQAIQCEMLNQYWETLGKPQGGIPMEEGGRC
ncbi:hypothetical protein [Hyphobacterium sp.]|uniref:hypothetical protein n=1 Tax=Hyphobacterium sp. TaxID=2004662 RepID=UPI003BAAABE6